MHVSWGAVEDMKPGQPKSTQMFMCLCCSWRLSQQTVSERTEDPATWANININKFIIRVAGLIKFVPQHARRHVDGPCFWPGFTLTLCKYFYYHYYFLCTPIHTFVLIFYFNFQRLTSGPDTIATYVFCLHTIWTPKAGVTIWYKKVAVHMHWVPQVHARTLFGGNCSATQAQMNFATQINRDVEQIKIFNITHIHTYLNIYMQIMKSKRQHHQIMKALKLI